MIEFALFRDGNFSETRYFDERPANILHKGVAWYPVQRVTGEPSSGIIGDAYVVSTAPPVAPPRSVHIAWLEAALAEVDKLASVEAAVGTATPAAQALWRRATTISESDPEVIAIASVLEIDLPALFDRANAIRVSRGR